MNILNDFTLTIVDHNGAGQFEDDPVALHVARTVGKNRRKRLRRYLTAPEGSIQVPIREFLSYLQLQGIVPAAHDITRVGRTVENLLEFLWTCPYESEEARAAGQYVRNRLLRIYLGVPENAFGNGALLCERL